MKKKTEKEKEMNKKLFTAVNNGDIKEAKLLIENGVDVNAVDNFGANILIFASCLGHLEIVKALVGAGANINVKDGLGWTALTIALNEGRFDVVDYLKSHKTILLRKVWEDEMENKKTIITVTVKRRRVRAGGALIKIGEKCKIKSLSMQLLKDKESGQRLIVSPGKCGRKYEFPLEKNGKYEIGPNYWVKIAEKNIVPDFFKEI